MIQSFLIALQFLTSLPVHLNAHPDEKAAGYSLLFYPVIGLIIGGVLMAIGLLMRDVPALAASALWVTAWIMLTGGLHLDGLADTADAWMGGMGDAERTLTIMKDPHCGAAGVIAVVLIILLKFTALHSLFIMQAWVSLLCAIVLARTMILLLFLTTSYVRPKGLGAALAINQPRWQSVLVIVVTFTLILWFFGSDYVWLLLTALLVFGLLRHLMIQRIQGTTGDTAGAMVEITETSVLLAAVLFVI